MTSTAGYTASYNFSNTNGVSIRDSDTVSYTLTGSGFFAGSQNFSGTSAVVTWNGLTSLRHVFLANQNDTSGTLSLSLNSAQTQVFSQLGVGESIVLPSTTTGIWASGVSGITVSCAVFANGG